MSGIITTAPTSRKTWLECTDAACQMVSDGGTIIGKIE